MKKVKVYDSATRLFHWAFVFLFIFSFYIAKAIDDESPVYTYHKLAGMLLACLALWRILMGFVGGTYIRFSSFPLAPSKLLDYLSSLKSQGVKKYVGHNPASAWATIVFLGSALGLALTGMMMTLKVQKHTAEEVHEFFAHLFLVAAVAHVLGVIYHQIRHRDQIAASMLTGFKQVDQDDHVSEPTQHQWLGLISLVIVLFGVSGFLYKSFDSQAQTLTIGGKIIQVGEVEEEEKDEGEEKALPTQFENEQGESESHKDNDD